MRFRIRGKYYTLRYGRPMPKSDAHCDYTSREIVVSPRVQGEHKMDCLIHELLHAAFPDLNEDAINTTASDVARLLWRLGYRDM